MLNLLYMGAMDMGSPYGLVLSELHREVFFYLVFIRVFVLSLMLELLFEFWYKFEFPFYLEDLKNRINVLLGLNFADNVYLEVIWTVFPALVLGLIAYPSLEALFFVSSDVKAESFVGVCGSQWYWTYEVFQTMIIEITVVSAGVTEEAIKRTGADSLLPTVNEEGIKQTLQQLTEATARMKQATNDANRAMQNLNTVLKNVDNLAKTVNGLNEQYHAMTGEDVQGDKSGNKNEDGGREERCCTALNSTGIVVIMSLIQILFIFIFTRDR